MGRNNYFDENSRSEIQELIDKGEKELTRERFYKDLEFGTGGMRSILGAGVNRINTYTVRKASRAMTREVINANPQRKIKGTVSYDSRKFSFEFASSRQVFAEMGFTPISMRLNPVALLSFSVRHHKLKQVLWLLLATTLRV